MIVDAHVHLWDAAHTPQPWMTAEHHAIARPFGPDDLRPLLDRNGIDAVVLVQGACLDSDTDYLLAEADEHEWIAAVTAWLPLDQPQRARDRLDELEQRSTVRAVRHLIHNEADPHWILRRSVLECLDLLEDRRVVLELPVVFPRHLDDVPILAERFPELPIVIDHPDWVADDFVSACHIALDCFGPQRLMCGSDWPVLLLNGDYDRVWDAMRKLVEVAAGRDAAALLGENAARIYSFADVQAPTSTPAGKDEWQHR
jgi:L-fuconolactonase